ncbi:MAG TPA: NAD(P)/FAD-dependent oxidoreductase [Flavobacteriales bacterium]|jgi:geranylgeranyl reductase family protein|nr:NAD(P)/FAD-dependent oxidoreductase [Flavobacteriales bacterium]
MADVVRTDVCIVGAGPGGCAAAITLAKHGVRAALVEKGTFPRDKVCGDALSGKVMRALERLDPALAITLRADARQLPSWGVTFVAPNGKALRVPFSRHTGEGLAPGAIMPRLEFDALLFARAMQTPGIAVHQGVTLKNFERTSEGWRITDAQQRLTIEARLVIAADGANSQFARHVAGLQMEPRHHCAGVRAYYSGVSGLDPQGFIELIFLKELLPGYLWIFPLPDGRANVGLGLRSDVVRKRRVDLKALMQELIATHPQLRDRFANARAEGPIQGLGLPLASKRRPLSGDGYLLVGDAGHLIDPFTGEGISHAMISGMHAGDVAAEVLSSTPDQAGSDPLSSRAESRDGSPDLRSYDARVWKRLGKELAISTRLQQLADKPWLFNFVVGRALKNPALADTISSMFNDLDLRERLKKPGFYLDLMFGRTPNA